MNAVMKRLKEMNLTPTDQQFDMDCSLRVEVRLGQVDRFEENFGQLEGCRLEICREEEDPLEADSSGE